MEKELLRTRLIFSAIVVVVFLLGGYWWQKNTAQAPVNTTESSINITTTDEVITAYLEIEGVNDQEIAIQALAGQTLLGVMRQLNETDPRLNLQTQDYPGLGSLVVQIGNWHNGTDNKYWQYQINDTAPMVGADQYLLQANDRIKWEFKQSEY